MGTCSHCLLLSPVLWIFNLLLQRRSDGVGGELRQQGWALSQPSTSCLFRPLWWAEPGSLMEATGTPTVGAAEAAAFEKAVGARGEAVPEDVTLQIWGFGRET